MSRLSPIYTSIFSPTGDEPNPIFAKNDGAAVSVVLEDTHLAAPEGKFPEPALGGVRDPVRHRDAHVRVGLFRVPRLQAGIELPYFLDRHAALLQKEKLLGLFMFYALLKGLAVVQKNSGRVKILA